MKIFLPIIHFGKSGGFRVLSELANNWIDVGHEVAFICYSDCLSFPKPYFPTTAKIIYIDKYGKVIEKTNNTFVTGFDTKVSPICRIKQLIALLKSINNLSTKKDIILATYSLTAYCVNYSKKNDNKYYYIQAYEPEYFGETILGRIKASFISKTYNFNLQKIVNSPIYYNYKNLTADKCVYPGLDFAIFNNNGKVNKLKFNKSKFVIGCIGRKEKVKGTQLVIDAYNILLKNNINCVLKMAVFGCEDLLQDNIEATIPKNDFELAAYYKSIDVLVAPGTSQFGAVHYPVIEAMACGTAVITTAYHPAHPDNAWITPPFSGVGIANQIQSIIENPDLALYKAKKAMTDIKHLSWPSVATEMLKIFQSL
jgi:glycosyltransferase involved in cell wall biosynthesis